MPKRGTVNDGAPTVLDQEKTVLKRLTDALDIHPRDVVVLAHKRNSKHQHYDATDPTTWKVRRYFFRRNEAAYELYLDIERKPGDDEEIGLWAEAVLVDFPTEEMAMRFAQIAARRAARGGQKRILPVGHPDYDGSEVDAEPPDDRGVKLSKISISDQHDPEGLMEGSAPILSTGEQIGSAPEGRPETLGDVTPSA
jgi:hypothetical protein